MSEMVMFLDVPLLYRIVLAILGLFFHIKLIIFVILNFVCKWMEIENTILSEITQTQKYEYGMYSFISEL